MKLLPILNRSIRSVFVAYINEVSTLNYHTTSYVEIIAEKNAFILILLQSEVQTERKSKNREHWTDLTNTIVFFFDEIDRLFLVDWKLYWSPMQTNGFIGIMSEIQQRGVPSMFCAVKCRHCHHFDLLIWNFAIITTSMPKMLLNILNYILTRISMPENQLIETKCKAEKCSDVSHVPSKTT